MAQQASKISRSKLLRQFSKSAPKVRKISAPSKMVLRVGEREAENMPNAYRQQQNCGVERNFIVRDARSRVVSIGYKAKAECWLDRYHNKGALNDDQYVAGMMFRRAWLASRMGISWMPKSEAIDRFGGLSFDYEASLDEKTIHERIVEICLAKLSPKQKIMVETCCGHDEAVGVTARIKTLQRGLDAVLSKGGPISKKDQCLLANMLHQSRDKIIA